jgi:hypothetical protein
VDGRWEEFPVEVTHSPLRLRGRFAMVRVEPPFRIQPGPMDSLLQGRNSARPIMAHLWRARLNTAPGQFWSVPLALSGDQPDQSREDHQDEGATRQRNGQIGHELVE